MPKEEKPKKRSRNPSGKKGQAGYFMSPIYQDDPLTWSDIADFCSDLVAGETPQMQLAEISHG